MDAARTRLHVSMPLVLESKSYILRYTDLTLRWIVAGCYGMFCCPCQFGDTSRILGSADCFTACAAISFCTPCVLCCAAPGRRGKLRSALGVNGVALPVSFPEPQTTCRVTGIGADFDCSTRWLSQAEPCGDCYVWAIFPCCAPLANCQEARELKVARPLHDAAPSSQCGLLDICVADEVDRQQRRHAELQGGGSKFRGAPLGPVRRRAGARRAKTSIKLSENATFPHGFFRSPF